jgi:uncharacterized membrane protein
MFSDIMGPVDKNSCMVFYILSILFFTLGIIALIGGVIGMVKGGFKGPNRFTLMFMTIWTTLSNFVFYYLYRVLNTICLKVL